MKQLFITLAIILGISFGFLVGLIVIKQLPTYPIPRHSELNQRFGIWRHEVIGFLPYWLVNKASSDYSKTITTLTYFGLEVNPDGSIRQKTNPKENEPGWNALKSSKKLASMLQDAKQQGMTLSLLVHQMEADKIDQLLTDPETHAHRLISDVEPIMKEKGFTDLNIDVESFGIASPAAQAAFNTFLRTIKQDLTKKNLGTLSIDLIASSLYKPYLSDPKLVGEIVDTVIFMTYDYHYAGSWITGPVAPLGGAGDTREFDVKTVIAEAPKVIPESKLVLGMPLYGYEWETLTPSAQAAVIPGSGRSATHERVMTMLKDCPQCTSGKEVTSNEPFIWQPEGKYFRALFYEDAHSISEKLKLIQNWKGSALWALGYEDDEKLLSPLEGYLKDVHLQW